MFADDKTLQLSSSNLKELFKIADNELLIVSEWFKANKLTLNVNKTNCMLFRKSNISAKLEDLSHFIDDTHIERIGNDCKETSLKLVGVHIVEFLHWNDHFNHIKSKLTSFTYALSKVKNVTP